ncbi:MAG: hypothetical protein J7647_29725 [Cyanobacteria bacterium SBLK]|nr:hypothetical protein [Cyanobacteria bacterium SBLK]
MTDGSNKIQIGDMGEDFNASNSIWNLDEISGKVTRTISELSPSPEPTQLGIKEILGQLQEAINTDNNLSEQDKTTALQQVQLLAEASKDPKNGAKKNIAKNAITMLKGILSSLPTATKLVETCQQLVPTIATIFGF